MTFRWDQQKFQNSQSQLSPLGVVTIMHSSLIHLELFSCRERWSSRERDHLLNAEPVGSATPQPDGLNDTGGDGSNPQKPADGAENKTEEAMNDIAVN